MKTIFGILAFPVVCFVGALVVATTWTQPAPGQVITPVLPPAEQPPPTFVMERLTQIGEHTQVYIVHDTQERQCTLVIRDTSPVGTQHEPRWDVSLTSVPWACAEIRK